MHFSTTMLDTVEIDATPMDKLPLSPHNNFILPFTNQLDYLVNHHIFTCKFLP